MFVLSVHTYIMRDQQQLQLLKQGLNIWQCILGACVLRLPWKANTKSEEKGKVMMKLHLRN